MIVPAAAVEDHRAMSTVDPHGAAASAPGTEQPKKRRNPWIWISAALGLIAVGLLVWALTIRSDLDGSQQDVEQLQSQLDQGQENGSTVIAAAKSAYDSLVQQLGSTSEDLAAAEQDLATAKQGEAQAEQEADTAKQAAAKADNATDQAKAEADQARAEAQAAESKAAIASDCAKAYVGALGKLFEGDSVRAQASAVGQELQGITADCKGAFAGS
jgi:uncharacterized membrane-anchored protein YhcB (DUF1043 family)